MKIAINGFGRIGRPVLKIALENPEIEVVAINDLGDINCLAYLLKYDTAYGVYSENVEAEEGKLTVGNKEIKVFSEMEPAKLPWKELEVDVVVECTGVFKDREGANGHIEAGARKVVISAPTKDESVKTIVIGCNEDEVASDDDILSMASCTTNCIAPMTKVLDDEFGIEKSLMSTIHSYTSTQALVDSPAKKDVRRGRAAAQNIVPSTTGAAIAAAKTLPQLQNIFDGMAFRVPTLVGSVSDVVALLKHDVAVEDLNEAFKNVASGEMKDVMETTEESLVSHDIVGNPHSCIVDLTLTKVVDGNLVKVVGWYDNEWGYSNRLIQLAELVAQK
ncbi:MAG: type I glyceraldehyde-3-phosphate dehydrogenase [Patescibacteria group bacterium]|nr:type I glyceraldehyde-3-phosphate dehydrogenase [Patescibacteria group bacterium]